MERDGDEIRLPALSFMWQMGRLLFSLALSGKQVNLSSVCQRTNVLSMSLVSEQCLVLALCITRSSSMVYLRSSRYVCHVITSVDYYNLYSRQLK